MAIELDANEQRVSGQPPGRGAHLRIELADARAEIARLQQELDELTTP